MNQKSPLRKVPQFVSWALTANSLRYQADGFKRENEQGSLALLCKLQLG
jgi:hypothetical protein